MSDPTAGVRWPVDKLDSLGAHPCVLGFSGSMGRAGRARWALQGTKLHQNMFQKRERIRDAMDRCPDSDIQDIKQANAGAKWQQDLIALWGLEVYWAEGNPHILEYERNGDCFFPDYFRAIGSGATKAYAFYRTLGGKELTNLEKHGALLVILRILRTCVNIALSGVSEPYLVWIVPMIGQRKYPKMKFSHI